MWNVRVHLLPAAVDVVAEPRANDLRTRQVLSSPSQESVEEPAVQLRRKELVGERADVRVLVGDVPVVPHETLGWGAAEIPETIVEHIAHLASGLEEVVGDEQLSPGIHGSGRRHLSASRALR